jgi:hypothetical protein
MKTYIVALHIPSPTSWAGSVGFEICTAVVHIPRGVFFLSLAQVAHYAQAFGMNVIAFDDPVPEADLKAVGIEKARLAPNPSAMSRGAPCLARGRSLTPPSTPGTHRHARTHAHSESAASLEHGTHARTHTQSLRLAHRSAYIFRISLSHVHACVTRVSLSRHPIFMFTPS